MQRQHCQSVACKKKYILIFFLIVNKLSFFKKMYFFKALAAQTTGNISNTQID